MKRKFKLFLMLIILPLVLNSCVAVFPNRNGGYENRSRGERHQKHQNYNRGHDNRNDKSHHQ